MSQVVLERRRARMQDEHDDLSAQGRAVDEAAHGPCMTFEEPAAHAEALGYVLVQVVPSDRVGSDPTVMEVPWDGAPGRDDQALDKPGEIHALRLSLDLWLAISSGRVADQR